MRKILNETSNIVYVCSHRAVHQTIDGKDYPENSMTGINIAIDNEIDLFECDIRATLDGVLILMHDPTIDRTTNGSGKVSEMYYKDLAEFNLKNFRSYSLTMDTIPTLEKVLEVSKNKIFMNLDIKNKAPVEDVLKLVQNKNMLDNVMFFTSSQADARYLIDNGAIVMPSCYNNKTFATYQLNNTIPLIFQTDNTGFNEEWISMKSNNIKIYDNVYLSTSTLPDSDNWEQLNIDLLNGVNVVQTDYPIEMINYLKTINRH